MTALGRAVHLLPAGEVFGKVLPHRCGPVPVLRDHYRSAVGHRHFTEGRAWSCALCRAAILVVNPRRFLDHLSATVELAVARSALREIITLADQAPVLTDEQLRSRLLALADRAVLVSGSR